MVRGMSNGVRLGRSIWGLERENIWDAYTLAYAQAVVEMQKRAASDPTSWQFQAEIHANSCQHQTWFFLPWHRLYIAWFERIVQALVDQQQDGPSDWALPYWDWQADRALPPAFREERLPASAGGGSNPLYTEERDPQVNRGAALRPAVVGSTAAEASFTFSGGEAAGFGFGGGDTQGPSHWDGGQTGLIELQPHNNVHRTIAGIMGTGHSPLDPIFWLHHAQVDRLWARWLETGGGRANPTAPKWLCQPYEFYDPSGDEVTQTPQEALSTTELGYRYEDQAPPAALPLTAVEPQLAEATLLRLAEVGGPGGDPRELGASGSIELGTGATTATIELAEEPASDLSLLAAPDTGPRSVALVLEDIRPDDLDAPSYEVYLNSPEVDDGGHHDSPHFVGFLEFFGAGHSHGEHGGGGLKRVFDITTLVYQLERRGVWDPDRAQVTFVPARVLEDPESGELLQARVSDDPAVKLGNMRIVVE
jgi:tyrosinase-like protein